MSEEVAAYRAGGVTAPKGATGTSVLARLASRFGVDPAKMQECLMNTAFKGGATPHQVMALCIVADQYGLNPWTKEIFAFPDKANGIVPVVGVDGWSRIINEHPQYDGMEFVMDDKGLACTCTIYRKDRSHPVSVTEHLAECKRNTAPWASHPRRMLRHKAMIQAARLAFGYAGIYDQDEAERIVEATVSDPPYADQVADKKPSALKRKAMEAKKDKPEPDAVDVPAAEAEPEPLELVSDDDIETLQ